MDRKNIAKINGKDTEIDPYNLKVVPLILNGRTMLPIRFVAENLVVMLVGIVLLKQLL